MGSFFPWKHFRFVCSTKVEMIIAYVENCLSEITNEISKLNSLSYHTAALTNQFIVVNAILIDAVTWTNCVRILLDSSLFLAFYSNHKVFHLPSGMLPFSCLDHCNDFYVLSESEVSSCSNQIIAKEIFLSQHVTHLL